MTRVAKVIATTRLPVALYQEVVEYAQRQGLIHNTPQRNGEINQARALEKLIEAGLAALADGDERMGGAVSRSDDGAS